MLCHYLHILKYKVDLNKISPAQNIYYCLKFTISSTVCAPDSLLFSEFLHFYTSPAKSGKSNYWALANSWTAAASCLYRTVFKSLEHCCSLLNHSSG